MAGYSFYVMNHFYDDIENMELSENGKEMMKVMMRGYKKKDEAAVLDNPELKEKFWI